MGKLDNIISLPGIDGLEKHKKLMLDNFDDADAQCRQR
jgi:hypothetical protein